MKIRGKFMEIRVFQKNNPCPIFIFGHIFPQKCFVFREKVVPLPRCGIRSMPQKQSIIFTNTTHN